MKTQQRQVRKIFGKSALSIVQKKKHFGGESKRVAGRRRKENLALHDGE